MTSIINVALPGRQETRDPQAVKRHDVTPEVLVEGAFRAMLRVERRRAERSHRPFILMLLDAHQENGSAANIMRQALAVIAPSFRETDVLGWYKDGSILGVIFTELGPGNEHTASGTLQAKIQAKLKEQLGVKTAGKIFVSVHVFPEKWDPDNSQWTADSKLYPELQTQSPQEKLKLNIKTVIDLVGSAALLLLLSPVLAVIALVIKVTSKGPVLFEQERLGQFGGRFKCLKFRTMYLNNDSRIHQDYVHQYITGKGAAKVSVGGAPTIYKIDNDPRVTPIGKFLRKVSLDEFPQFWNVLRGEMSLVGPRPPVPYEFQVYDYWHRRRVLEVKPGVTGLWQVKGRSRTEFDEMVRLDLQYSQSWSLWLDLKILAATPWAVFSGDGAY